MGRLIIVSPRTEESVQLAVGWWLISTIKMRILTVLWLLTVLRLHRSDAFADFDSTVCRNRVNPPPLMALKNHLFCDYDPLVRPVVSHKEVNNVTIKLIPKILEFDEMESKMVLHSWMTLLWTDSHLTWKPSEHDGITYLHVKSDMIWVPDLSVYNSGDMAADQNGIPPTTCLVFSSGSVSCVPSLKHIAKCATDFAKWPYDTHQCRINFGSWSHSGEEVDFHLDQKGFQMAGYTNSSSWDFKVVNAYKVLKKYKCCPNDTYPMIVYEFSITRHHGLMHTTYITPAIAVMLLTLTVLWLDSRSIERMAVASVNLVCHLLCIFDLHWQLPQNGSNPPNILLYYRDSLALAVFALILTAVLRKMQTMNIEVPYWISSTTSFVLNNRAGRFLILADDDSNRILSSESEDNVDLPKAAEKSKESSWRHFAAIVEWLSFFVVVLTYIVILVTLVPST
nr:neuronal acetylcholine receptor subunit alpha-9-like [Nomia melanderi]